METQIIQKFNVIGIAVRTTNENGQSSIDIPALWAKFMSEGIATKIPNKISDDVYCIYTDYEKDHTAPYTTVLGCQVSSLYEIPEGMTGKIFEQASYTKRIAKGNIMEGMVFHEWVKIWNAALPRTFVADFEVYGEKSQNPENAEVEIFIGVK